MASPPSAPAARAPHPTRARLARAALELFTTQGYHVTTTPELAKRAGVAEGTIYRHFSSKNQLLNELYRAAARWATGLAKRVVAPAVPAREQLYQLATELVAGAEEDTAQVRLFFLEPLDGLLDQSSGAAKRDFHEAVTKIVAEGKSEGSIRVGAAAVSASVWLAVLRLVLERVAEGSWQGQNDPAVQQAIASAWDAIAVTSSATPT